MLSKQVVDFARREPQHAAVPLLTPSSTTRISSSAQDLHAAGPHCCGVHKPPNLLTPVLHAYYCRQVCATIQIPTFLAAFGSRPQHLLSISRRPCASRTPAANRLSTMSAMPTYTRAAPSQRAHTTHTPDAHHPLYLHSAGAPGLPAPAEHTRLWAPAAMGCILVSIC